jgi:hypothetical protein
MAAGLAALDQAVGAVVLDIEDGCTIVPGAKAQIEDPWLAVWRRAVFGRMGLSSYRMC